jgi:hypothetical protein
MYDVRASLKSSREFEEHLCLRENEEYLCLCEFEEYLCLREMYDVCAYSCLRENEEFARVRRVLMFV